MSLKLCLEQMIAGKSGELDFKLHLGCGANLLPGWINTDTIPTPEADYLDCTRKLPFADNSLAAVFCEHLLEHMEKSQARGVLQEVFRTLRPKGVFRIVTPSMENFARLALEPQSEAAKKYVEFFRRFSRNPQADLSDAINLTYYGHGHRHIYMAEELAGMLRQAGFQTMHAMRAGTYKEAIFNGVDGHGKMIGDDINAIEAFAIEAQK